MDEPIRVLHVFSCLNRGGAETMIMNLYRNIDRTKVQFDFIEHTSEPCDYDDEVKELGGKIYRFPRYTGKNHFKYKNAWNEFFQEHSEYKIIHGHIRSTAAIYLKIAKKYGLITIAHSHNTSSGTGFQAIVKNILQYPIRYIADYFFACSKSAGEWLFGEKICNSDNFFILKNAIDTKKFIFNEDIRAKKRRELQIEDKLVVGHVGRFHTPKNHNFIIKIFYEIQKQVPNAVLLLIGDGELRPKVEKQIEVLGIKDKVILTGVVPNVNDYMQAMDVFVFPSLFEGLPVALVEAQASGLPCVVSDVITREVAITPYIKYVSLNLSPEEWAKEVLISSRGIQRYKCAEMIVKAGFDVVQVANDLCSWYIEKYKSI